MRNKASILIFSLLIIALGSRAQERHPRQLVVPLADGGFVVFKSETAWADTTKTSVSLPSLQAGFDSEAMVDQNHVIHRVLVDASGRFIFGYDLFIEPSPALKRFKIAVNPLDVQFEKRLIARNPNGESAELQARISTLPQSADPQDLDDGDSFALDLLINQNTGVKIVDVVKVSFDRSKLWDTNPKTLPRDFTLDAVEMIVKEYRLLINGTVAATGKPTSSRSGALLWFYITDRGRFIFSLVPRQGYAFQKVGIIEDNKIEFTLKGDRYEWISKAPVLPGGGTWNLWILHDPKYTPLFDDSADPMGNNKGKREEIDSAADKLWDRINRVPDKNPSAAFRPDAGPRDKPSGKRIRVIVGGADRIENLWPKQ